MKWNWLLYGSLLSGIGAFAYLLLVNYTDLTPRMKDALYSKGTFVFFILVFNVVDNLCRHPKRAGTYHRPLAEQTDGGVGP